MFQIRIRRRSVLEDLLDPYSTTDPDFAFSSVDNHVNEICVHFSGKKLSWWKFRGKVKENFYNKYFVFYYKILNYKILNKSWSRKSRKNILLDKLTPGKYKMITQTMIKTKKIYAKKDERQRQFKAENVQ